MNETFESNWITGTVKASGFPPIVLRVSHAQQDFDWVQADAVWRASVGGIYSRRCHPPYPAGLGPKF